MQVKSMLLATILIAMTAVAPVRADETKIGRPVRIVTLSFARGRSLEDVVDREAAKGVDLIVLPEVWTGNIPEALDGPSTTAMASLARKHKTYVVNPVYREVGESTFNSAILLNREGKVACIYDKVCLFPPEYKRKYEGLSFNALTNLQCGKTSIVFQTDFGKVGFAICFDCTSPQLWQQLADKGAELVVFPSAYPGGLSLQALGGRTDSPTGR